MSALSWRLFCRNHAEANCGRAVSRGEPVDGWRGVGAVHAEA